ncbi:hypothetical protein Q3G72_030056 [Acer saccharum]|nr:hypothetical protein Q3G72_030056 [Acer saccharum]
MVTAQFIIHGLWPVNKTGSTLQGDGTAAPVVPKDIQSDPVLYNAMNKNWPSLNGGNFGFWSKEWKKHGSADPAFNNKPLTYFKTTIAVKNLQGSDLFTSLRNKKIKPGSSTSKNNCKNAMESSIGIQRSVILKCYKESNNILHLSEVYICVDAKATKFIACNANELAKDTCGTGIGNVKLDQ